MQGIWLEGQKLSFRKDIPEPKPQEGEAVIRTRMAGICSTDLELVRGYYPFTGVLGHEFVGEVVKAPSAPDLEGKRVVGEINVVCGECAQCQQGRHRHCLNRTTLGISGRDGVFAEYFSLPVENLLLVPDSVPDRKAVFVEPLAAAVEILDQTHIKPTDAVMVVGAGRLGQLISQVLFLTGCDLKVVVRHDHQRQLLEWQGIITIPEEEVQVGAMDVVVDATGVPGGFKTARKAVRPRGRLVLKSTYADTLEFDASALVVDEISLIGSRCGPFAPALRLIEKNLVDPSLLISQEMPLTAGLRAFERAKDPDVIKILLAF